MTILLYVIVVYILIGIWFSWMCTKTDPEYHPLADPWDMFLTLLPWPINLYFCVLGWFDGSLLGPK
jgi:hypothetical protein